MKKSSTIFLQIVIVLLGLGALTLLLIEPRYEGVNAGATTFYQIYFDDPFLMLVYVGSIPFFVALYQTIRILSYARMNQIFSSGAVLSLRKIKYCALTIIGFVVVEEIFIMLNHGNDDAAGGIMMGVLIVFGSILVATVSTIFERILQNAVDIKAENDLTV
jgi:hypothetical protein